MGLPPVVAGLAIYILLSRAGPLGELGLLFTPEAMVIAQCLLVTPIIAALSRQTIADLHGEYDEQLRSLNVGKGRLGANATVGRPLQSDNRNPGRLWPGERGGRRGHDRRRQHRRRHTRHDDDHRAGDQPRRPRLGAWLGRRVAGDYARRQRDRHGDARCRVATGTEPTAAGAAQFRRNLNRLVDAIETRGGRVVICSQVMAASPHATPEARRFLGDTNTQQQKNAALGRRLQKSLQEFAESRSLPFVDAFHDIPANTDNLGDAIHLTAAGERQLADLLTARLSPLFAR